MNPKRITFSDQQGDEVLVLVLGELGLFSRAIAEKTGLTLCQVNYRLNRAGITRRSYRDGSSQTVSTVIGLMTPQLRPEVQATALDKLARETSEREERKRALNKAMSSAMAKAADKALKKAKNRGRKRR